MTTTTIGPRSASVRRPAFRRTNFNLKKIKIILFGNLFSVGGRQHKISVVSTDSEFEQVVNNTDMTMVSLGQGAPADHLQFEKREVVSTKVRD